MRLASCAGTAGYAPAPTIGSPRWVQRLPARATASRALAMAGRDAAPAGPSRISSDRRPGRRHAERSGPTQALNVHSNRRTNGSPELRIVHSRCCSTIRGERRRWPPSSSGPAMPSPVIPLAKHPSEGRVRRQVERGDRADRHVGGMREGPADGAVRSRAGRDRYNCTGPVSSANHHRQCAPGHERRGPLAITAGSNIRCRKRGVDEGIDRHERRERSRSAWGSWRRRRDAGSATHIHEVLQARRRDAVRAR